MHLTDEQLVTAYLNKNDQQAFRTLVERHQERIFGYLIGMVRDRDAANDLFQEAFLRAISAMHARGYQQQGRWVNWMVTIARNAALDYLRSQRKWADVTRVDEEDGASFWDQLPDDLPSAEEALYQAEQSAHVTACVARLPHEQREVLLLKHEAGLTFREIAEITGCSINTALGRMRYALQNLRRMMTEDQLKEREPNKGAAAITP